MRKSSYSRKYLERYLLGVDLNTFEGQNNLGIILMTIRNNLLNQG